MIKMQCMVLITFRFVLSDSVGTPHTFTPLDASPITGLAACDGLAAWPSPLTKQ
jgi:hypothetical protein